jgi:hypothetical protein
MREQTLPQELATFLEAVPCKHVQPLQVPPAFEATLERASKGRALVFVYDIEFQQIRSRGKPDQPHLLEFGGIIFVKTYAWHYLANVHFSLPPAAPLKELGVFQSKYATVSPETQKRLSVVEGAYLWYDRLAQAQGLDAFRAVYSEALASHVARQRGLGRRLPPAPRVTQHDVPQILKVFRGLSFTLGASDVGEPAFAAIWQLYYGDAWVQARLVSTPSVPWLRAFRALLVRSANVVKGDMDISALNNLFASRGLPRLAGHGVVDIAEHNNSLHAQCGTAQLEGTVDCLYRTGRVTPSMQTCLDLVSERLVLDGGKMTAHNPLVDAFLTLVVLLALY